MDGEHLWFFPSRGMSAKEARDRLREALTDLPIDSLEMALLLTSELVTNAVVHGDGPVGVHLVRERQGIRVSVHDHSETSPEVQHPGPQALGGRGLLLVEQLASGWGFEGEGTGKSVWFTLRV